MAESKSMILAKYLDVRKTAIQSVLPKHVTKERLMRVALQTFVKTPGLAQCAMETVFNAIMQAAELGLEPGGALGHCYLVPFKGECVFIIGYQGLMELARRSERIETIEARVVREGDVFQVRHTLREDILDHAPAFRDGAQVEKVYAIATFKSGLRQFVVLTKAEVDKVRAASRSGSNEHGPWSKWYEQMAMKTAVKRLAKYLPLSAEFAEAVEQDDEAESAGALDAEVIEIASSETTSRKGLAAAKAKLGSDDGDEEAIIANQAEAVAKAIAALTPETAKDPQTLADLSGKIDALPETEQGTMFKAMQDRRKALAVAAKGQGG